MTRTLARRHPISFKDYIGKLLGQPSPLLMISAFLLALLGNVLAAALGDWQLWGVSGNVWILIGLGFAVLAFYVVYRLRQPHIKMQERPPTGKAGVILLLSTLNPRGRDGDPEERERRNREVQQAAGRIASLDADELDDADYDALLGTNLEPNLRALEFHHRAGTLRECWTVGTPDEARDGTPPRGSAWLGIVLERWFNRRHPGSGVRFSPSREVKPRDYVGLWNTVDEIFRRGPLRANAIICDVTGGLKLMSVGAALACVGDGRAMQYMATDRDWRGEPVSRGDMVPVLVDISPYFAWEGTDREESATQ